MFLVALLVAAFMSLGGAALAQQYPPDVGGAGGGQGEVDGDDDGALGGAEEGAGAAEGGQGNLAVTGAEVTMYVLIGLGAIGLGTLIVRQTRTKTNSPSHS
jgi:hypothetical protein